MDITEHDKSYCIVKVLILKKIRGSVIFTFFRKKVTFIGFHCL